MANERKSRWGKVRKGIMKDPLRVLLDGPEGVGKSTLAADAPSPIFFDLEGGTSSLDVDRYTFRDGADGHVPLSLAEVYSGIADLLDSSHEYETLVIDTVDRLEALLWAHMLERDSGKQSAINKSGRTLDTIESYGYQKGYQIAVDEWRKLLGMLEALRLKRTVAIVFIGHVTVKTFKNPEGEDYDRYALRVHDKAAGVLKEWVDIHGFCTFEEGGGKLDKDQPKAKGYSTGRHLLKLRRSAAYDAKTRIPLPAEVEMLLEAPWGPFAKALKETRSATPKSLVADIKVECKRLGDAELTKLVGIAVNKNKNNVSALARYLADLRDREVEREEKNG